MSSRPDRMARFLLVSLALAILLGAPRAHAQIADPQFWVTNGTVNATALVGNTLYVGGQFTSYMGPSTGGFVAVDSASGAVSTTWPRVNGGIRVMAPDGAGGFYIGGIFTQVAGLPRSNLAHIRGDGSVAA